MQLFAGSECPSGVRVTVDGRDVTDIGFFADDEAGVVHVYPTDADGKVILNPAALQTYGRGMDELHGKVVIEIPRCQ